MTPDALDGFVLLTSGAAASIYALSGSAGQTRPRLHAPGAATWSTLQIGAGHGGRDVALTIGRTGQLYLSRDYAMDWYAVDLERRSLPSPCAAGTLTLSAGKTGAALGNTVEPIYLKNTSHQSCVLAGYPTVSVMGGTGPGLSFHDAPGSYIAFTRDTGPALLGPGGYATVFLSGTDDPPAGAPESSCSATTSMVIHVGAAMVSGNIPLSGCRSVRVSPVVPGIEAPNGV